MITLRHDEYNGVIMRQAGLNQLFINSVVKGKGGKD